MGSLGGGGDVLKDKGDVVRGSDGEEKCGVEEKGKSGVDFDFECE